MEDEVLSRIKDNECPTSASVSELQLLVRIKQHEQYIWKKDGGSEGCWKILYKEELKVFILLNK